MSGRRESWIETFRALGEAFFEVLRAELALLLQSWKVWGRSWLIVALLAAAVLGLLFWLLGLLAVAVVHGFMVGLGLQLWQSALLTAGLLLLLIAAAAIAGYVLARRFENPAAAARHRLDDHRTWLRERVLLESPTPPRRAAELEEGESHDRAQQGDEAGAGAAGEPPRRA